MKRILFVVFAFVSLSCTAQNRVDSPAPELSFKSQPIKRAIYWEQKNGKWESRKSNKLVYLGEGVDVENFEALFTGVYADNRYLFLDKHDYFWRYPATQVEWYQARTMHMALLSDSDWDALQNIEFDHPVVFVPRFEHSMSKAHLEYSFPLFIDMGKNMQSSTQTMYDSYVKHEGEAAAEAYWKSQYKQAPFMVAKRVNSNAGDVVRFRFGSSVELIDAFYFEVPYSEWLKLFKADKSNSYK